LIRLQNMKMMQPVAWIYMVLSLLPAMKTMLL
jgi:hypothetical protein